MTAAISQQTVTVKDAATARKRRRRAPAGGAADDCFTCIKRNVKCDRRRPYCSQCLEVSNECSGYKTRLTWGVGVASRGKLRGLSLPIAKAPPVSRETKKSPSSRSRELQTTGSVINVSPIHTHSHNHSQSQSHSHGSMNMNAHAQMHSSAMHWPEHDDARRHAHTQMHPVRSPIDIPPVSQPSVASAPATPYGLPSYDYLSMSHSEEPPMHHHGSWNNVGYSTGMVHSPEHQPKYSKFPLPLVTEGLSSSVSSVNSDVDYMSPMSQSYHRDEVPFINSPTLLYDHYSTHQSSPGPQSPPSAIVIDHSRAPTSCPGLVYTPSEPGSLPSTHPLDVFETQISHKMMRECDNLNARDASMNKNVHSSMGPPPRSWHQKGHPVAHVHNQLPFSGWKCESGRPGEASQELASRMPFFMDYYTTTLCPAMVFIDGPGNPFRDVILDLARGSPSLQHAICAFSACNLRMKRKLSLGLDAKQLSLALIADKKSAEGIADVDINDPALSEEYQHRNLAVYLLNQQLNDPSRCGHDSVVATILLLCHYRMMESGVAKFQIQFAGIQKILSMRKNPNHTSNSEPSWMQRLFTHFDAISASVNDREAQLPTDMGVVENLVGCDHRLLHTIRKLGRINLLSQKRPVRNTGEHTGHSVFWVEWQEARQSLQTWQFNASTTVANLPSAPSLAQTRDLRALSEAFRYAALLYLERLANPDLPSRHSSFQQLVTQVVHYATDMGANSSAEKFLLWPLFVAGSECVNHLQQNIIRTRCLDMMSRSGYMDNLSALEVLEKLWSMGMSGSETGTLDGKESSRNPFNWASCLGGPGVDVEWIMF
ncbi:unnamed protein product [Clonostachys chloroleuca]|uniref:Zn(2)-C6 fungal-type domain-containing protein n=1 Tax=Clonostachys chloroleuca TaxID=1926264 RepID=A0AA35Q568_9HYPO|nr:unnamed protein product [Clonostachys chloroleuca]